jgi:hypothetical protein
MKQPSTDDVIAAMVSISAMAQSTVVTTTGAGNAAAMR